MLSKSISFLSLVFFSLSLNAIAGAKPSQETLQEIYVNLSLAQQALFGMESSYVRKDETQYNRNLQIFTATLTELKKHSLQIEKKFYNKMIKQANSKAFQRMGDNNSSNVSALIEFFTPERDRIFNKLVDEDGILRRGLDIEVAQRHSTLSAEWEKKHMIKDNTPEANAVPHAQKNEDQRRVDTHE